MAKILDLEKGAQMKRLDKNYEFGYHGGPVREPFSSGKALLVPRSC